MVRITENGFKTVNAQPVPYEVQHIDIGDQNESLCIQLRGEYAYRRVKKFLTVYQTSVHPPDPTLRIEFDITEEPIQHQLTITGNLKGVCWILETLNMISNVTYQQLLETLDTHLAINLNQP